MYVKNIDYNRTTNNDDRPNSLESERNKDDQKMQGEFNLMKLDLKPLERRSEHC